MNVRNNMDLQDKTRMLDAYKDINNIIDQISNLPVFPPLVWVWTWDVVKSTHRDFVEDHEYAVTMDLEETWALFWEQADQNGFTLEYGTEDLYEAIRDWMLDAGIVEEALDEDEDDVVDSEGGEED
jgi:hypothetical protein